MIFVFVFVFQEDNVIESKGLKGFRELLCVIQAIGIWIVIVIFEVIYAWIVHLIAVGEIDAFHVEMW